MKDQNYIHYKQYHGNTKQNNEFLQESTASKAFGNHANFALKMTK